MAGVENQAWAEGEPTGHVGTAETGGPGTGVSEIGGVEDDHVASAAELVVGTGTGLRREVGRLADGRRITYYTLPPGSGATS